MRSLVVAFALVRLVLHVLAGVVSIATVFPWASHARRERVISAWSRRLLAISGIRVRVVGTRGVAVYEASGGVPSSSHVVESAMRPEGIGAMIVLNHISWADIFVINTVRRARFVAKSEIDRWPVIGFLTRHTGTIFIERGKRHAVREANQRIIELLGQRDLIAMFPEGMTGDGDRLLPFHANLLQPAIDAGVPIIVGGLRYLDRRGRPTIAPSYAGEINLVDSFLRILRNGPFVCELHLIDAFDGTGHSRHAIARRARAAIAQRLGFDDEAGEENEAVARADVSRTLTRGAARSDTEPETESDPQDELL